MGKFPTKCKNIWWSFQCIKIEEPESSWSQTTTSMNLSLLWQWNGLVSRLFNALFFKLMLIWSICVSFSLLLPNPDWHFCCLLLFHFFHLGKKANAHLFLWTKLQKLTHGLPSGGAFLFSFGLNLQICGLSFIPRLLGVVSLLTTSFISLLFFLLPLPEGKTKLVQVALDGKNG